MTPDEEAAYLVVGTLAIVIVIAGIANLIDWIAG